MAFRARDELEEKQSRAIFPTRRRAREKNGKTLPSVKFESDESTHVSIGIPIMTLSGNNSPQGDVSMPIIYETNCGTSLVCRIVSTYISAAHIPCQFREFSCAVDATNNVQVFVPHDEADREVPEYKRTKVPALEDNGFFLFEFGAIIRYLDLKFGPVNIFPRDPRERAIVDQAFEHISATIRVVVQTLIQNRVFNPMNFGCGSSHQPVDNNSGSQCLSALSEMETLLKYISKYYFRCPDGQPLVPPEPEPIIGTLVPTDNLDGLAMMAVSLSGSGDDLLMNGSIDEEEDYFMQVAGCAATHILETRDIKCQPSDLNANRVKAPIPPLFLVLNRLTLADTTLFAVLEQLCFIDYDMENNFPLVWHWQQQMRQTPELRKSHEYFYRTLNGMKKNIDDMKLKCARCSFSGNSLPNW
eukprot:282270_1